MNNIFDTYANDYDVWFEDNRLLFKTEAKAVSSLLDEGVEYAEIGCGTGIFAKELGITEGIEPSLQMGAIAKNRGIDVKQGSAQCLPYASCSKDGLIMITVDCFIADLSEVFFELHRVLRSGGSLIIAFIDKDTPLGALYEKEKENSIYYKQAIFRGATEIALLLTAVGFEIADAWQTVFTLENREQEIKKGNGEGVFALFKARKK